MSAISFSEAKKLVLARLQQVMKSLPASERSRPRYIIDFKPYSVLDMINMVTRDDPKIRTYVYDQVKQLGYVVT